MREDYLHESLIRSDNKEMELDVYIPALRLALEYHGEQHYRDIYSIGARWRQKERDEERRLACLQFGITLIQVPYSWDFQLASLKGTIQQQRHDSFVGEKIEQRIPSEPPSGFHPSIIPTYQMTNKFWDS